MEGITNFKLSFTFGGKNYEIFGNSINRSTTDGGGNPVYYAKCYEIGKRGQELRTGVANLTSDWKIKSLFI